jgi:hypothetical protein
VRPSHATELAAAAEAALERLDHYLNLLEALLRSPGDLPLYQRSSEDFDAMRALTASLPHVRICWVEVLVSRMELLNAVGRKGAGDADGRLARLHERHLEALGCFRRHCWDYISSNLALQSQAERARGEAAPETLLQIAQRRVLEAERHVRRQRELIERLEALGADASAAHKVLGTMQDALDGMCRTVEAARRLGR